MKQSDYITTSGSCSDDNIRGHIADNWSQLANFLFIHSKVTPENITHPARHMTEGHMIVKLHD